MPSSADIAAAEAVLFGDEDVSDAESVLFPPTPAREPTLGERYTSGIAAPARGALSDALGGMGMLPVPKGARDFIAGAVVPGTLTEAGALLGSLLVPEARMAQVVGSGTRNAPRIVNAARRIAAPAIGGAGGGLTEAGDPMDAAMGAFFGGGTGVAGEVFSFARKWLAKAPLARRFYREDPDRLGRAVAKLTPEVGTFRTPEEFGAAVFGTAATDRLSDMYTRELGAVSRAVAQKANSVAPMPAHRFLRSPTAMIGPRGAITSPVIRRMQHDGIIGQDTTFDGLAQSVRDLRLRGRDPNGDPKLTFTGRQHLDYAGDLSREISDALSNSASPRVAKRYQAMDRRYGRASEMLRYLRQPGIIDENGRMDMRLLQDQFKTEQRAGLEHRFKPAEVNALADAVFRGSDHTVSDIIRRGKDTSLHVYQGEGGARVSLFSDLMDMLRGNDYAGDINLGFPYAGPRAETIGTQRGISGLLYEGVTPENERRAQDPVSLRR